MPKKTTLALLLLGAMGCQDCNRDEALRGALEAPPEERFVAPSEAEAAAFVDSLLAAAKRGDVAALSSHFDWIGLVRRGTRGLTAPEETVRGMVEGASEAARERGLVATLASAGSGAVSLRHLGAQERDGETWQVFRVVMSEGGFDHLAFLLEAKNGRARIVDVWQLTMGENSSDVLRRMLLPTLADGAEKLLARLTGKERAYVENIEKIIEAQRLAAGGRGHDALHLLDQLPENLRKERFVMLQRVAMAQGAGREELLGEVEALAAAYPDDPTTQVHLIDGYVLKGEPERALEAVDRIEAGVLPDPYLDVIRANVLGATGEWGDARVAAKRAIEREPDLEAAHWPALVGSLAEKDFADTSRLLRTMHEKFGTEIDPASLPIYEEFVRSPEYRAYEASREE